MERQLREHNLERSGIELIKDWAIRNNVSFEDVHYDFSTGIDIVLDGKPYDLKVTKSSWLTFVKRFGDTWYSPLELHPDVPYLILRGNKGYVLNKKDLLAFCTQQSISSGIQLGVYVLDGNINITFNADRFIKEQDFDFGGIK